VACCVAMTSVLSVPAGVTMTPGEYADKLLDRYELLQRGDRMR